MRSRYKIDTYQSTYFVVDSFQQLFDATAPDFTPVYREVRERIGSDGEIDAGVVLAQEKRFSANPPLQARQPTQTTSQAD